ncbi:MAG: lytic transglycosylase domain-containing protein [Firmicutes bacterium]|nr:lytic transglycosylase domain-containing protein [Bacillota bacterium]
MAVISLRRAARWALTFLGVLLCLYLFFHSRWYLERAYPTPYKDLVTQYCAEHNVDPFLVTALMRVESRFRPHVVSEKGARGLMQVMPDTARWVAQELGMDRFDPEMLHDPRTNLRIGTWYLASLEREFGGDKVIVLAAYNAGRGNVRKWLDTARWTGRIEEIDRIPFPETRDYVRKVLRFYETYVRVYDGRWSAQSEGLKTSRRC